MVFLWLQDCVRACMYGVSAECSVYHSNSNFHSFRNGNVDSMLNDVHYVLYFAYISAEGKTYQSGIHSLAHHSLRYSSVLLHWWKITLMCIFPRYGIFFFSIFSCRKFFDSFLWYLFFLYIKYIHLLSRYPYANHVWVCECVIVAIE